MHINEIEAAHPTITPEVIGFRRLDIAASQAKRERPVRLVIPVPLACPSSSGRCGGAHFSQYRRGAVLCQTRVRLVVPPCTAKTRNRLLVIPR